MKAPFVKVTPLFWACGPLAALAVFVVPFWFPGSVPQLSLSYAAGYSNRAAVLGVMAVAALALLAAWFSDLQSADTPEVDTRKFGFGWFILAAFVSLLYLVPEQILAFPIPRYFRESAYFLPQMERILRFGDMPYRDFEFAYGPLLAYLPASLASVVRPAEAAYYFAIDLTMIAGLWMLWSAIAWLEFSTTWKICIYAILTSCVLNPSLGMNYTMLRFAVAIWLLTRVMATGGGWVAMAGGSILAWGVSPEAGVGFTVAAGVYLAGSKRWVRVAALTLGPLLILLLFGPNCFDSLFRFSGGFFNFVIPPAPYILVYLAVLVWVIPAGLARIPRPETFAMAGLALVYLSPTLGRCDPGHVILNGIPAFLLGLVVLPKQFGTTYLATLGLLFGVGMHLNREAGHLALLPPAMYYRERWTKSQDQLLATMSKSDRAEVKPIFDRLEKDLLPSDYPELKGLHNIATPFYTDKYLNSYLMASGTGLRDYYTWTIDISDIQGMRQKIAALDRAEWVVMDIEECCWVDTPESIADGVMFPVTYSIKRPMFEPSTQVRDAVLQQFESVRQFGRYRLYGRRTRTDRPAPAL